MCENLNVLPLTLQSDPEVCARQCLVMCLRLSFALLAVGMQCAFIHNILHVAVLYGSLHMLLMGNELYMCSAGSLMCL